MTSEERGIKNHREEQIAERSCSRFVGVLFMSRSCVCVREKGEGVPMLDGLIDEVKEIVPRK